MVHGDTVIPQGKPNEAEDQARQPRDGGGHEVLQQGVGHVAQGGGGRGCSTGGALGKGGLAAWRFLLRLLLLLLALA